MILIVVPISVLFHSQHRHPKLMSREKQKNILILGHVRIYFWKHHMRIVQVAGGMSSGDSKLMLC